MENVPQKSPAAQYLAWGFNATPVLPRTKAAYLKGWPQLHATLEMWRAGDWTGIVCGVQRDGSFLVVLDLDHGNGIDAQETFDRLHEAIGVDIMCKSFTTRSTSGNGYHIWFKIPHVVGKGWLRNEQGTKIGDLLGAGGHVVTQPTKHWVHGYPDLIEELSEEEYTALLAAINYQADTRNDEEYLIDWRAVDQVDISKHLNSDGIPLKLAYKAITKRYLTQSEPIGDTSAARYGMTLDLISANYSDEVAAAILLQLGDFGASARKSLEWLKKDIARCIKRCRDVIAVEPDRLVTQGHLEVGTEGGRPRKKTQTEFLYYLEQNNDCGRVLKTQEQIASDLHVSVRTVRRREKEAADAGLLKRHVGSLTFIELVNADNTSTTTERRIDQSSEEVQECVARELSAPETAPPTVAVLVEEALDMSEPARFDAKRVRGIVAYVQGNGRPKVLAETITTIARLQHEDRQKVRQDARYVEQIQKLKDVSLRSKIRGLAGKQKALHEAGRPREAWVWGRMLWFCEREMERRQADPAWQRQQRLRRMGQGR